MDELDELNDKLFSDYASKPQFLNLYEEAALTLDKFMNIIFELASYKNLPKNEVYDLDLMADLAGTMQIQLLNAIKEERRDYEYLDDNSQLNENGSYE